MKASMKVEQPGDVLVTMTITLPLRVWRELREQLGGHWPAPQFSSVISSAIYKIEQSVFADDTEER